MTQPSEALNTADIYVHNDVVGGQWKISKQTKKSTKKFKHLRRVLSRIEAPKSKTYISHVYIPVK